jgi:hypothetical protein
MPHPVYGWMGWLQILSPTAASFHSLRPLLSESLALTRAKWARCKAAQRSRPDPRRPIRPRLDHPLPPAADVRRGEAP